jgi:hypothetical protein
MKVSDIASQYKVESLYQVTEGASIVWHKNGKLSYLSHFAEDTQLSKGVWVRGTFHENVSSAVNWDRESKVTWVQVLARPIVDSNGKVLAKECQSAFFQEGTVIHAGDLYHCR